MRKVTRPVTNVGFFYFFFNRARLACGIQTCCHGDNVGTEQEAKSPCCFVSNLHVHVHLRVNSSLLSWRLSLQRGAILVSLENYNSIH